MSILGLKPEEKSATACDIRKGYGNRFFATTANWLNEKLIIEQELNPTQTYTREEIMEIIFPKKPEAIELIQKDFGNFRTKNTPTDGKCMFGAVFIALGRETDIKSVNDLRNFVGEKAEAIGADPFFVELLKTPNQWTGQNYAGIGLEALWYVAQTIKKPIVLIIEEEKEGKNIYRFWDSTQEQHLALKFFYEEVGEFLQQRQEQNLAAIFIYHNCIHFQAIVPQDTPQGTPSN